MLEGLGKLFEGKLFDKEEATRETVQDALSRVSDELKLPFTEFFISIMPQDKEFNHKFYICKYDEKGNPKPVREITLKEILGEKPEG